MSEYVTDWAVEKVARDLWEHDSLYPWDVASHDLHDYYRDEARASLEAVAPMIAAKALRDAAEVFGENQMIREGDVKEWLRLRADKIKGEER